MPSSERIETLISPEALKQFDQLKTSADANVASFEKLVAKAVELNKTLGNASSFKEIIKATDQLEQNDQELIIAHEEVAKSQDRLKKANKDLGDSFANVGNKISGIVGSTEDAFEKLIKLNDALKAVKNSQKDLAAQKDTFAQMNQSLPEVQQGLKLILDREKELKAEEILLKKNITDTNKEIKQRLNLNLVTPGTRDEIKQTIAGLKELRDFHIDINTDEGKAQIAEINKEVDRLNKIMEQTTDKLEKRKINIGNYPGAVKLLQQSLVDVNKKIDDFTKSGNQNDAMLQALIREQELLQILVDKQSAGFNTATAAIKGNQQAILLLSEVYGEDSAIVTELTAQTAKLVDTVGDMKATIKAQASDTHVFDGLIGAAQGLVGVYSVAQGAAALFGDENEELQKTFVKLQAVMSVLQGLQAIQNALQKESAARQLLNIGLQKVANVQTSLQTALESKNIVVRYGAIVAQKALNLAMSAAGGPILAIIGLIALMLISLRSFASQTELAAKSLGKLSAEFDRDLKALEDYSDFVKNNGDELVAAMEAQFASESDIRKQRTQNLRDQLAAALDLEKEYGQAVDIQQAKLIRILKKNAEDRTKEEEKLVEDQDALIQKYRAQQKKRADLASQVRVQIIGNEKATTEETIKARQEDIEAFKSQLQTRLQLQQSIAGDERKSQSDRINALKESARIQRELINAGADSQRLTPGLTPSQIKVIETQRTAALTQARRESNKAIEDLNRSYAERERKARFDIIRTEIEDQIKADDLITQNEKNGFDKRLDALYDGYQKRRDIVIAQHDLDIQNDTLTAEERIAIEKKYISDINGLTVEYGLQQQALYQQNQDKVNEIIEKGQQARLDNISAQQSAELIALNERFSTGKISIEDYERERANIEHRYRLISLQQEVNNATAVLLATKEGTAERAAALKDLKDKTLAYSDEATSKQIDNEKKLADLKKQLATEAVDTFNALVNFQFDNESARIQKSMDDLDKQTEKEKEVANATITNKEEKELALAKIDAKAQAQREQLEKRQRQVDLDRARFEKAANIAQIITSTAVAIINQLKVTPLPAGAPLAAAIAAIGALQLARAIAAPLPKFADGTDDAPGGLSWVGDGGKKELVITPQGQVMQTPSVPTVMNVPKHSIVLPDARAALESGLAVNRHGRLVDNSGADFKEVGQKIENKIESLTKVMRNKPVLNMSANQSGLTAMWQYGANWVTYADDQTRF